MSNTSPEKRVRRISEAELMPEYLAAMDEFGRVTVPVSGTSMTPFLGHIRDTVTLEPADGRGFKKGDIVLYTRGEGGREKYIMHRVVGKKNGAYVLCGDAQTEREFGVAPESIRAVARSACRKGKNIDEHSFIWLFFRHIWRVLRPVRPAVMRAASLFKRR